MEKVNPKNNHIKIIPKTDLIKITISRIIISVRKINSKITSTCVIPEMRMMEIELLPKNMVILIKMEEKMHHVAFVPKVFFTPKFYR